MHTAITFTLEWSRTSLTQGTRCHVRSVIFAYSHISPPVSLTPIPSGYPVATVPGQAPFGLKSFVSSAQVHFHSRFNFCSCLLLTRSPSIVVFLLGWFGRYDDGDGCHFQLRRQPQYLTAINVQQLETNDTRMAAAGSFEAMEKKWKHQRPLFTSLFFWF